MFVYSWGCSLILACFQNLPKLYKITVVLYNWKGICKMQNRGWKQYWDKTISIDSRYTNLKLSQRYCKISVPGDQFWCWAFCGHFHQGIAAVLLGKTPSNGNSMVGGKKKAHKGPPTGNPKVLQITQDMEV